MTEEIRQVSKELLDEDTKKLKPPSIHGVVEVLEDKGVAITMCGWWFNLAKCNIVPDETEITCKSCLQYMRGVSPADYKGRSGAELW